MIENIILISFWVFAIHYTMKEGEIFSALGDWFYDHLPKKLHSPVFSCAVCMCPHYGTILWFLFPFIPIWIQVVIAAMGLNSIIIEFFPHDDIKKS